MLPAHEELQQIGLFVSDHWQFGEAAQDDEDRRDPQGHVGSVPVGPLPGRRLGTRENTSHLWTGNH